MAATSSEASRTALPTLDILDLEMPHKFERPSKRINDAPDVSHFFTTLAYRDIGIFILQLNHSLCPRNRSDLPSPLTFPLTTTTPQTNSIQALQTLLFEVESFIGEAPPDPGPRRFGNVSFRKWSALLEERASGLLGATLGVGEGSARDEVVAYLLGAFGSAQRLDYGTGHELSFLAFLGCLWKLNYFKDGMSGGEVEREICLSVVEPYLRVVRKLIITYTLEPAGSHGVWGLDDHSFMPYIFGSAQLTRPIADPDPMPQEGSVMGAPKPSDVTKAPIVEDQRRTNMYFSAIGFINDVKKGPFWEHSPILFDISGIRDGWGKINKGMIKMYNAEVLAKFPVVQHFPFGSLFSWDRDPDAALPPQTIHMASQPQTTATAGPPPPPATGTAAPWAQTTRMPESSGIGIPYTRAPPRGPEPDLSAPMPPPRTPTGRGSTGAQVTVTRAPWAKKG